jgi:hypothetical protein
VGSPARAEDYTVAWRAQTGPQTALLACPVFEALFGGARGGGKTDGMLGEFTAHGGRYGNDAVGLMVRRERTQLIETIERSKQVYPLLGAKFHEQDKYWRFPNGARLRFAYLERDADAESYQGHSYTRVYVEELGNFPNEATVLKLMATLRSAQGVPTGFRATANPGGPGHQWVKARYIDANPAGWEVRKFEYLNPFTKQTVVRDRVFIPSRLSDNPMLLQNDPGYVANLQMQGSENLVKAWLEGDWSVIDGAFFDGWSTQRHVLAPFEVPADWARFRAFDWGSARPFSVGWWAIVGESFSYNGGHLPRGALLRYREWYGASSPNVGLKLTAEQVADGIIERDGTDKISYAVADPAIFSQDGGPSIAERMAARKVTFRRADNKRVAQAGAMGGWDQMRARLRGDEDGNPMLFTFSTCKDSIRTIPALQHDSDRPEDLDTDGEDHAADEWRYACMSRPWVKTVKESRPAAPVFVGQPDGTIRSNMSIRELIEHNAKRRNRD